MYLLKKTIFRESFVQEKNPIAFDSRQMESLTLNELCELCFKVNGFIVNALKEGLLFPYDKEARKKIYDAMRKIGNDDVGFGFLHLSDVKKYYGKKVKDLTNEEMIDLFCKIYTKRAIDLRITLCELLDDRDIKLDKIKAINNIHIKDESVRVRINQIIEE